MTEPPAWALEYARYFLLWSSLVVFLLAALVVLMFRR